MKKKCLWITSPCGIYPMTHCDKPVQKGKSFCTEHYIIVCAEMSIEDYLPYPDDPMAKAATNRENQ